MATIIANPAITAASVWLYLTEKGRENKKKPFKYWLNHTEIYFEVSYAHPTSVFDVGTLLADAYKSFLQSVCVVVYDNEKKRDVPTTFQANAVFSNPIIDNINLITWTSAGWTFPFRCTINLPIDKVKYVQLFVCGWAIEFTLYAKVSSKNKLETGAPHLFSILGEMQRAMLVQNQQPVLPVASQQQTFETNTSSSNFADRSRAAVQSAGNVPVKAEEYGTVFPDYLHTVELDNYPHVNVDPDFEPDPLFDASNESPPAFYTSDSTEFDSMMLSYPEYKEEAAHVYQAQYYEQQRALTAEERAHKKRLQGPVTGAANRNNEKEKESRSQVLKKKIKREPLLTPKKEGKITQYQLTAGMNNVTLGDPKEEDDHHLRGAQQNQAHQPNLNLAAPTTGHMWNIAKPAQSRPNPQSANDLVASNTNYSAQQQHGSVQQSQNNSGGASSRATTPSVSRPSDTEADREPTPNRPKVLRPCDAEVESEEETPPSVSRARENQANDRDLSPDVKYEIDSSEDEYDEQTQTAEAKSAVFNVPAVRPAIVQIAERTGMEREAMDEVIKIEKYCGYVKGDRAVMGELHSRILINGKPLKHYDHVLAFAEDYATAEQRKFFFFVDCKNKLRVNKGESIEVAHETLEYSLHVKEYGKYLASYDVVNTVRVKIQNFFGFIAIAPKNIGVVIFVPYAFKA